MVCVHVCRPHCVIAHVHGKGCRSWRAQARAGQRGQTLSSVCKARGSTRRSAARCVQSAGQHAQSAGQLVPLAGLRTLSEGTKTVSASRGLDMVEVRYRASAHVCASRGGGVSDANQHAACGGSQACVAARSCGGLQAAGALRSLKSKQEQAAAQWHCAPMICLQ